MFYIDLILATFVLVGIVKSRQLITVPSMQLLLMVGGWMLMLVIDQQMGLPVTATVGFLGLLANIFVGIYVNYRNSIPLIKGE